MNTDPIADLLTRIKNAHRAGQEFTLIPYSKIKWEIVDIFEKNAFIDGAKLIQQKNTKEIKIVLPKKKNMINLKRISKPGRRVYKKHSDLQPSTSGYGIYVISTSKGLMTSMEAKELKIGGELLCEVY